MPSALWSQLVISLSGHPPFFHGDIGYQIRNEEPDELEYVSRETNDILQNCLAKDYKLRYRASEQVIESLGIGKGWEKLRLKFRKNPNEPQIPSSALNGVIQ